jgi:hypothetical protein
MFRSTTQRRAALHGSVVCWPDSKTTLAGGRTAFWGAPVAPACGRRDGRLAKEGPAGIAGMRHRSPRLRYLRSRRADDRYDGASLLSSHVATIGRQRQRRPRCHRSWFVVIRAFQHCRHWNGGAACLRERWLSTEASAGTVTAASTLKFRLCPISCAFLRASDRLAIAECPGQRPALTAAATR